MTDIDRAILRTPEVFPPEAAALVRNALRNPENPTARKLLAAEVLAMDPAPTQGDGGACDGCDTKCSDCPEPSWQVAVEIPARLPSEVHDSLFTAVADAVHEWEPDDRDGWDAFVSGHPTRHVDPVPTRAKIEAALEYAWDDGNAVGLDGWIGPNRGAGEVDNEAVRARRSAVEQGLDSAAGDPRNIQPGESK